MTALQQAFDLVNTLYAPHSPHPYVVQLARPTWQALAEEVHAELRVPSLMSPNHRWDAIEIKNVRFVAKTESVLDVSRGNRAAT